MEKLNEKTFSDLGSEFVNLSLSHTLANYMARKVMEVKIKEFSENLKQYKDAWNLISKQKKVSAANLGVC